MLKTILTLTKLEEKAFQAKTNDFLSCNDKFWRDVYQEEANCDEIEYVFSLLVETIEALEIEEDLKYQVIGTINELNYKCQTSLFLPYIEGIKEKLKIIVYYLLSP
ncbi:MAG: hypothetical protein REH83_00770, partial [Rickettsiella sp.]|nr:hypothetical protein [Rickettsiella sp.]